MPTSGSTPTFPHDVRRGASPRPRPSVRWILAGLTAMAALLLAGCATGGSDDAGFGPAIWDTAATEPMPQDEAAYAERSGMGDVAFDGRIDPVPPGAAPTGRSVIRTGEIWLETGDTDRALDEVLSIARDVGGYAATTDLRRDEDGAVTGWVTLRVPTERLNETMTALEAVGTRVPVSRIDEFDVSAEVADIEARLSNLRAFETELVDLLAEVRESGGGAEELVVVFERIREVRWEIEHLEARERRLDDQVSMATITVRLTQPAGPPSAADVTWRPSDTLATAWAATVRTLAFLADAIIWVALTVLPIALIVLTPPAALVWWLLRRRQATRTPPPPPPGTASVPGSPDEQ